MENNDLQQENLVREISYPLTRAAGWMKFLGIVMIIYGALAALSIVGIIIAWLPIWIGLLLIKASNNVQKATQTGNKYYFINSLQHLNNYFTITGILLIISIILGILIGVTIVLTGFTLENLEKFV